MPRNTSKNKPRIVVAMSGGVDSSVAAYLLKKQGYDVVGIFLKLWQPPETVCGIEKDPSLPKPRKAENLCCDMKALFMARQVADRLDIPFYVIDVSSQFKKEIVDDFVLEYERGRTPNPCVLCNKKIKFGVLWDKAKALGADYLATGHYIKAGQRNLKDIKTSRYSRNTVSQYSNVSISILRSRDSRKDQTYFLSSIDRPILSHLLFPVGGMDKARVRSIAKRAGLSVYNKKDSQGICFIPDGNNDNFLSFYAKKLKKPGDIVDKDGNVLGKHEGLLGFTIGQKVGLEKVGSILQKQDEPIPRLYVVGIDARGNRLIVGEDKDCFAESLVAENVNILDPCFIELVKKKKILYAQIRGGHKGERCVISFCEANGSVMKVAVRFLKPVRAIAPGQTIAFYDGERLLGGGIIQ